MMTQSFFTEVHLLAGKLVLIVAIHSLGGSRANWHHTLNPQQGAAQPTKNEDHTSHEQFTRVPFGSPLGKGQEPLKSPRSVLETSTFLCSTILAAQSHLGGGTTKSNKRIPQQNTNTKCLQMQSLKQGTWIHSESHKDDESMMEMSGRALAKLTRLLCQCK